MNFRILLLVAWAGTASAQQIGLQTTSPDAPVHIWSSGQVQTSGGLLLLGHRVEGHMELDFNRIQSLFGQTGTTLPLLLQPDGGDLNVGFGKLFVNGTTEQVGIGRSTPNARLDVDADPGETGFRVRTDGVTKFIMDAQEQVGIGRSTPNARLDVDADPGETGFRVRTDGVTKFIVDAQEQVGIGDETPNARLVVEADVNETALIIQHGNIERVFVAGDGQVGIGSISPSARLQVQSEVGEDPLRVRISGSTKLAVRSSGHTAIGESFFQPASTLHVRHSNSNVEDKGLSIGNNAADVRWMFHAQANQNMVLYADNGPNFALHGTFLWALGDYIPASDQRMKKNIEHVESVLDRVMQLQPRKYNMRVEEDGDLKSMGFVAQEVQELFPENVRYDDVADKYFVIYRGFSVVAIKAIQELTHRAETQEALIDELRGDRESLERRIEKLEALIADHHR